MTLQKFKSLRGSGCGLTTMIDPIWTRTDLYKRVLPWLYKSSTSATTPKGEDHLLSNLNINEIFYGLFMAYVIKT